MHANVALYAACDCIEAPASGLDVIGWRYHSETAQSTSPPSIDERGPSSFDRAALSLLSFYFPLFRFIMHAAGREKLCAGRFTAAQYRSLWL